ncbi:30S ribosomal protein S15 [bacterium]|nr:30S ribosomal protein S15 [bacterium]
MASKSKCDLIKEYARSEGDTGSVEVQVALLSDRIRQITEHLKVARKDFHSRSGLLKLIGRRRRLLRYIQRKDLGRYNELAKRVGV